ncbi:MAG: hypothetical protein KME02_14395 [Aphanothece saxicola GSE-SYN-MK-01-06B]|jgi:hypothetical protein|nr:hypothetical protein [Aphanothece saxicola GSE-SYN-MK-01-06B]
MTFDSITMGVPPATFEQSCQQRRSSTMRFPNEQRVTTACLFWLVAEENPVLAKPQDPIRNTTQADPSQSGQICSLWWATVNGQASNVASRPEMTDSS